MTTVKFEKFGLLAYKHFYLFRLFWEWVNWLNHDCSYTFLEIASASNEKLRLLKFKAAAKPVCQAIVKNICDMKTQEEKKYPIESWKFFMFVVVRYIFDYL